MNKISVAVIDGQGGGIGSNIIKRLREEIPQELEIVALGTNAMATANMMKAKANRGASGENAIIQSIKSVDLIVGALSVVLANSMLGEITPAIAAAVASQNVQKILLPLKTAQLELAGYTPQPFPHLIDDLIFKVRDRLNADSY
jgi:4-hydroxy-L-threonine phosphate dehydrogenase PdxA